MNGIREWGRYRMNRFFKCSFGFLLGAALLATASCSSMTVEPIASPHKLVDGQAYELKVHTDKPDLDRAVYKYSWETLAEVLPIRKTGPYTGSVEVVFTAESRVAKLTAGIETGEGWYTGGYRSNPALETPVGPAPGARTYQTATLLVVVRNLRGKALWSAKYRFNGRLTLVDSPDKAARRCLVKVTGALKERIAKNTPAQAKIRGE